MLDLLVRRVQRLEQSQTRTQSNASKCESKLTYHIHTHTRCNKLDRTWAPKCWPASVNGGRKGICMFAS